jgi:hypothetical protein
MDNLFWTNFMNKSLYCKIIFDLLNKIGFQHTLPCLYSAFVDLSLLICHIWIILGELHADEYTSISLSNDMLNVDASLSREISRLQQVSIDVTDIHKGVTENALWIIKGKNQILRGFVDVVLILFEVSAGI